MAWETIVASPTEATNDRLTFGIVNSCEFRGNLRPSRWHSFADGLEVNRIRVLLADL